MLEQEDDMLFNVADTLKEFEIYDFWMISHNIIKYECTLNESQVEHSMEKEKKHILLFKYKDKIGKILFTDMTKDVFKYFIQNYLRDNIFYLTSYEQEENRIVKNEKKENIVFRDKIECIDRELYKKADEHVAGIFVKDIYIYDSLEYNHNGIISEDEREKNYIQVLQKIPPFNSIFRESKPYDGMIDNLLISQEKKMEYKIDSLPIENKIGKYKFSANVFSVIFKLLLDALNGLNILKQSSIFIAEDFGKKVFRKEINIFENSFIEQYGSYDDEGIKIKEKIIVERGILKECFNNLISANALGLKPGNCKYNYLLNSEVIEPGNIIFEFEAKKEKNVEYDVNILEILGENIILNAKNGNIQFQCIGLDNNNKYKRYLMNTTLLDFFNAIIGISDKRYEINGYLLPEVIVDFGDKYDDKT